MSFSPLFILHPSAFILYASCMQTAAIDVIGRCPLFRGVKGPHLQLLESMAKLQKFDAGTPVFRQGDECPGVYIVAEGLVRIFKLAPNGKEHVLHLVSPGQTFAEVAAIGGFNCPANAQSIADSVVVLLPTEPFMNALHTHHELCLQIMTGMCLWVRSLVGLLEDITLRDAMGRVAKLLGDLAQSSHGVVQLPAMKKHMASHLNLTSETLSRTLRRLSESGVIESDNQTLRVLDAEQLKAIAVGVG